jgi:hypothetical protein
MPYNTGQIPKVGDCIADKQHRRGIVSHIMRLGSTASELVIKWEDGTTGIRYTTPEDFELLDQQIEIADKARKSHHSHSS